MESVFDELTEYQNTIETGVNNQNPSGSSNGGDGGDVDEDLEMKGNDEVEDGHSLKPLSQRLSLYRLARI